MSGLRPPAGLRPAPAASTASGASAASAGPTGSFAPIPTGPTEAFAPTTPTETFAPTTPTTPRAPIAPTAPLAPSALVGPDADERNQRLHRLAGPLELHAAVLGLLLDRDSRREHAAWAEAARSLPQAAALLADLRTLAPAERLPWLEALARRCAGGPIDARRALMADARRLMAADGRVSPMDRLQWLALRHLLGNRRPAAPRAASGDLGSLAPDAVRAVCCFSAFLSRLVPQPEAVDQRRADAGPADRLDPADQADHTGEPDAAQAPGAHWYRRVTARWDWLPPPAREGFDGDATVRALRGVQALPWMLKPVLMRGWFDAAQALSEGCGLRAEAADALRLAGLLLEVPLPPALARQFRET